MTSWALILQAATDSFPSLPIVGIGGGVGALIFFYYRQDRKESERRYAELSRDFRKIVEDNTRALTSLQEAITSDNAATLRLLLQALATGRKVNVEPPPKLDPQ
jgi:hypothetical protein